MIHLFYLTLLPSPLPQVMGLAERNKEAANERLKSDRERQERLARERLEARRNRKKQGAADEEEPDSIEPAKGNN